MTTFHRRRTALLTLSVTLAAFAACSSDDSAGPEQSTPAVTEAPVTEPSVTEPPVTEPSVTEPPVTEPPVTEPPVTESPVTESPVTEPPVTEAPAALYEPVEGPTVPAVTDPIDAAWIESSGETLGTDVADGVYWAAAEGVFEGGDGSGVTVRLSRAWFGAACAAEFSGPDTCLNDYEIVGDPGGEYPARVSDLQVVTVVDGMSQQSYAIDGAELAHLVGGGAPLVATDYEGYVGFPFLATISDGAVIALEQVWVP